MLLFVLTSHLDWVKTEWDIKRSQLQTAIQCTANQASWLAKAENKKHDLLPTGWQCVRPRDPSTKPQRRVFHAQQLPPFTQFL